MPDASAPQLHSPPPQTGPLADARGRVKRKLRLSLTDRCNLRCLYCMPEHPQWLPKAELLRQEELLTLASLFVADLGIADIRLTGGEPLLRRDLVPIVELLNTLRPLGLQRIALTSNGVLLARHAAALKAAGLDDLNISLDVRTPERFRALTGGEVQPVLEGIDAARAAGLAVKLNSVVIRGYNEAEVLPLADWALAEGLTLRYIEFMPLDGRGFWHHSKVVSEDEIIATLRTGHALQRLPRGEDPATYYQTEDGQRIGVISTVSRPFCTSCDRVRLTATGTLFPCLFSETGPDLRSPLRAGASAQTLQALVRDGIWQKEAGYIAKPGYVERPLTMHAVGG